MKFNRKIDSGDGNLGSPGRLSALSRGSLCFCPVCQIRQMQQRWCSLRQAFLSCMRLSILLNLLRVHDTWADGRDQDDTDSTIFEPNENVFEPSEHFSPLQANEVIPFFMLGDFGGGPGSLHRGGNLRWKEDVAWQMGQWAGTLRPRFVVGLGDNFYDEGVKAANDSAWDEQFEDYYFADALRDVPWLMCLGNHDYAGRPEAQIARTGKDPHQRWYMPGRAYSRLFVQGNVSIEVFSVDTNAITYTLTPETAGACEFAVPTPGCSPFFEKEGQRVVQELETMLNESTATWKVVVGHHPLFSAGHHGSERETAPLRAALLPRLDRFAVDLYACGHDHIAQHIVPSAHEERRLQMNGEADCGVSGQTECSQLRRREVASRGGTGDDQQDPRATIAAATHHVSIGTSGPMIMPGDFDFRFEEGRKGTEPDGAGLERHASDGQEALESGGESSSTSVRSDVSSEAQAVMEAVGGTTMNPRNWKHPGTAGEGTDENDHRFELFFATKRRAFGVLEAAESVLRVSLVGGDGLVLYSFAVER